MTREEAYEKVNNFVKELLLGKECSEFVTTTKFRDRFVVEWRSSDDDHAKEFKFIDCSICPICGSACGYNEMIDGFKCVSCDYNTPDIRIIIRENFGKVDTWALTRMIHKLLVGIKNRRNDG